MRLKVVIILFSLFLLAGCFNQLNNKLTGQAVKSAVLNNAAIQKFCHDSDSGIDPIKHGFVEYDGIIYSDECHRNILVEYYCDRTSGVNNKNINCNSLGKSCNIVKGMCV